ncbi:YdeI/OmpD-associated family protein [Algoriphagus jejuensis]|uniref:YdeI/OmpD-associated family protein n=1 Tax=Algoriphagus jejuensis TaxID=419934 RepID=A0ABP3YD69_9BACT
MQEPEVFCPRNTTEWRAWLEQNHNSKSSVWVVFYSKATQKPSLTWSDAVDAALCYGWIDSKKIKIDHETSHQFFSKRKAKSTWSKINKDKIDKLMESGLMTQAGLDAVAVAKLNGSWTILDQVEDLIVPRDLEEALVSKPGAKEFFESLSKSVRKMMLTWLVFAKRLETRQNRIDEIAELASKGQKPKQF